MTAVLTLTPNPALDQTVRVPALRAGRVNVAREVTLNAGGKGVNVASCLADWGVPAVVGGFLGQANAAPFEALMAEKGLADHFVRLAGSTRTNIKVVADDDGDTTDINLPGFAVPPGAWDALLARVRSLVVPGQIVVAAGSLPAALQAGGYAPLLRELAELGATTVLDTSGDALTQALAGDAPLPSLIKPNRHELEAWAGQPLPDTADLIAQAQRLHARGVATVVVSLGEQGALLSRADGCWQAGALPVTPVSTVGAGDALVAGLVAARHARLPWPDALRLGVAFAAGKLQRLGPHLPPRAQVQALADQVQVHTLA